MAILGIDAGTSSVKALILDTQGHVLSTGKAGYTIRSPLPGWAESDPDEWWHAFVRRAQEVRAVLPWVQEAQAEAQHGDSPV